MNTLSNLPRSLANSRMGLLALLVGLAFSCTTSEAPIEPLAPPLPSEDMMVLGEQLENPYSLQAMQEAYDLLVANGELSRGGKLEATHYYVRFLPASVAELDSLSRDTTLELFDHPLDYAIARVGHRYHDPSIPAHLPTWQYTAVPVQYTFPEVRYEILEELYLKDPGNQEPAQLKWQRLEQQSLRLTGNLPDEGHFRTEGWHPSGRIRVQEYLGNTVTRILPLKYCKVRVRNWFKWSTTYTNYSTGRFYISDSYNGQVSYSLQFSTAGGSFKVTTDLGIMAQYNGPTDSRSGWDIVLNFGKNKAWNRATVMNAIYEYRQQAYRHSIRLPRTATIKLFVHFKSGRSNALGVVRHILLLPFSDVQLYTRYRDGSRYRTDHLHGLVMHELAHVSHFLRSPDNAIACGAGMVGESWAQAVEYYFTNPYYPSAVSWIPDMKRSQIIRVGWRYTPFFVDLRDYTNQRMLRNGDPQYAQDRVHGYTLTQMHTAMAHAVTLNGVVNYLEKNYQNTTEQHLSDLVAFYNDIKDNH